MSVQSEISIRHPTAQDAYAIHALIGHSPPLDENSLYCNLLQCSHFSKTCLLAEVDGRLAAFASGYRLPQQEDILFFWQIGVDPAYRGCGLGKRLLKQLVSLSSPSVRYLHTTITEGNKASWSLFKGLAQELKTTYKTSVLFDKQAHFNGSHETEWLMEIGPLEF